MSDSADLSGRVGVHIFPRLSELSSGGAWFSQSFVASSASADCLTSRALGMISWPEKPLDPSVVQAQEPKMRVVPFGTLLALLDSAIKFADEFVESPTWRAKCWCLATKPAQGYP